MPNWCFTTVTINHEDGEQLKKLSDLIDEWTSREYKPSDFGLPWLGNVIGNSGICPDEAEWPRCRGRIDYSAVQDGQLIIETETAWMPMMKMWKMVCDRYLPDAEIIYRAEECGQELYVSNDPVDRGTYVFDIVDDDDGVLLDMGIETSFELAEEDLAKRLQKLLGSSRTDVKGLLRDFEHSDWSDKVNIIPWAYDPDDSGWK